MMTRIPFSLSFLIFLLSISFKISFAAGDGIEILESVFQKNKTIKSISQTMTMQERINGQLIQKKTDFKVIFQPYKVYMKQAYPNKDLELLYVEGQNNGKLLINRNTRTFSNFKLDPFSNTVRKGNHHSIKKAGYNFLLDVLEYLWNKYKDKGADMWKYQGIVSYNGINCHKIIIDIPDFHYMKYTIKPGDNLESLSYKFKVCDYLIFDKNPSLKSFDEIKPGTIIHVPSDYAKQIIIFIDKNMLVPVGVKAYDEKGLFEEYLYTNIKINPQFKASEFDSKNPEYGFRP